MIALGVWSAVLASFGGFVKLASGAIFIGWIFYGLGAASIFPIRRANLGKALPYRVPGYPLTPLVFVLVAVAIIGNPIYAAIKDPQQFSYLLVAIVLLLLQESQLISSGAGSRTPKRPYSGCRQPSEAGALH